jgi:hypothetical protein
MSVTSLLGSRIDNDTPAAAHLMVKIDCSAPTCDPATVAIESASEPIRVRGWLVIDGALPNPTAPLMLAIAVDGVVRDFTAATVVSPHYAQFSSVVTPAGKRNHRTDVKVLFVESSTTGARLLRLPIFEEHESPSSSSSEPNEHAPWVSHPETFPTLTDDKAVHGFVDEFKIDGDVAHLIGWARNSRAGTPASRVVALLDGKPICSVRPWLNRPDVVSIYHDRPAKYGFILELPLNAIPPTGQQSLVLIGLDDNGAAGAMEWGCLRAEPTIAHDRTFTTDYRWAVTYFAAEQFAATVVRSSGPRVSAPDAPRHTRAGLLLRRWQRGFSHRVAGRIEGVEQHDSIVTLDGWTALHTRDEAAQRILVLVGRRCIAETRAIRRIAPGHQPAAANHAGFKVSFPTVELGAHSLDDALVVAVSPSGDEFPLAFAPAVRGAIRPDRVPPP